jgi:hypothetical protein
MARVDISRGDWIVRTETAGHQRYWKIGEVDSDRAAMMARDAASADMAKAITRIPPRASPALSVGLKDRLRDLHTDCRN